MKTVIVVISAYNGAKHIERQLDSIFEQVGVDVQVLVRDDCSKDNTVEVVQEYAQNHPQNKIEIIKGENVGFAKSFWLGLSMCRDADYYAFADQDDVWKEEKIISAVKCIENIDKPALYSSAVEVVDKDLTFIRKSFTDNTFNT